MEPTRRYWAGAGLGGLLTVAAVVLQRPLVLLGAASVGAWLLATQYLFVRDVTATLDGLAVDQTPARSRVAADGEVRVTLEASLDRPAPVRVDVEAAPPVGATGDTVARRATVSSGEDGAATAFALSWPVAGRFAFNSPTVTLTDPLGLFRTSVARGAAPTVTVEPARPHDLRVGAGGTQYGTPYGELKTGDTGPGLELAELREYVAGEPARRIDWNTTARLGSPHVTEYETEMDVTTALVVDHRASMGTGRTGRTKLDYARQAALAFADTSGARELLGLYAVGEAGITARESPGATVERYAAIRTRLHDLSPTDTSVECDATMRARVRPPEEARLAARRLETDDSDFGTRLRPFFDDAGTYVHSIESDPLYRTVRHATRQQETVRTLLFTDDTRRTELREAVDAARSGNDRVVAFLAPTVLFEADGLTDLQAAYDRYLDFESFRRELAGLDRVSAFELAPGERVDALLANRSRRPSRTPTP